MKYSFIIICLSFIFLACNTDKPFDKTQWIVKSDLGEYPHRNSMIKDLTSNFKITGLSYKELIDLIGEPEMNIVGEKNQICYKVLTEYGSDIDPISSKTLIIKLNNDSTIADFKVDEWRK